MILLHFGGKEAPAVIDHWAGDNNNNDNADNKSRNIV